MDVVEEPPIKSRRSLDENLFIIRFEPLSGSSRSQALKNLYSKDLRSLLDAASIRNNEVLQMLSPLRDDILNFQWKISYHKSCGTRFTSKTNLQYQGVLPPEEPCGLEVKQHDLRSLSRHDTLSFKASGSTASFVA